MKIGILIDRLNVGGVEKIAIEQVRALRESGEDAYLIILREKAVVENAFPDLVKKIPIIYLDRRLPKFLKFSFQFPVFHFFSSFHLTYPIFIPFVIKKNEFDYIIAHGTYTCFTAVTIRKFKGIKFSAFIWDPISYVLERVYRAKLLAPVIWLLHNVALFLDKEILKSTDVILAGGDAHNKTFAKLNPHKKVKIIYPSVHPVKKQSKKEDYVLQVTAWKQGKYPEYIFEIIKEIPNIKVKMVGKWLDSDYRKKFEDQVLEKNVKKNIDIVGEVSEEELTSYYAKALVVLQTNDDRGFGLPALEAAGHGTTFIIPKDQGVCKLFKDKIDGFYTTEKDTETIVKYIKLLYKDKDKAKKMGEVALEKVIKNYSWAHHAKALAQIAKEYGKK